MSADEEIAPEDLDVGEEGGEEVMDEVRFLQFTQPHSIERTTVFSQIGFYSLPFPHTDFYLRSRVTQELEAMKNKVKEMEDEAEKLRKLQEGVEEGLAEEGEDTAEQDGRSVYVGQVDYSATPEELQEHFAGCGTVNRVTILCDAFRNNYAYIEFDSPDAVEAAVALHESEFKGRNLKVVAKRTMCTVSASAADVAGASSGYQPCFRLSRARLLAVLTQDDVCMWWSGTFLS